MNEPKLEGPVFAKVENREAHLLEKVIDRALPCFPENLNWSRWDIKMDLLATHHLCPLDFRKLLKADDFNFNHDIAGIYNHLNRETGELRDFFLPRCAKK